MKCVETFVSIYNREPTGVAFCPYRICPIGAHSDHQHGKITGLAIDKGVHIAYKPKQNGVVELMSLQFPKRAQWHISATPEVKENDWADMLRGATIALSKKYRLHVGVSGVIEEQAYHNAPARGSPCNEPQSILKYLIKCRPLYHYP